MIGVADEDESGDAIENCGEKLIGGGEYDIELYASTDRICCLG